MIQLNGKQFAANKAEFMSTLFQTGGTCVGFYRRTKNTVILEDHQNNRIGVINKHDVLCCATKQANGKYWYSFATIKQIGEFNSYMQGLDECKAARGQS